MPWYDASYCCLCVQSSVSSPLHHFSYCRLNVLICLQSTCKPLFMFWHLILCCPSPYCIPHTIIKCRMTILISYFPCLAARLFPREDCSIRPLASLFAYLWIWNSLARMSAPSFANSPRCASLWPRRLLSLLQPSFVVSWWLLPEYLRRVPPQTLPSHLYQSTYRKLHR